MALTAAAFRFLRGLKQNNNKAWFEAHRTEYERDVREPMRALIEEMNRRMTRFAPEMGGDAKRSMFRINRDIRFSNDKSPYKTHAACWFNHRRATSKVGGMAADGSAGFYFHLEPGRSMVGAGLWMPPKPQLDKLRDAIAEDPKGFERVANSLKKFGGLDDEAILKRMPRGYPETHTAAKWLRYQSFTAGRLLTNSEVTGGRLPAILEKEFKGLLPLVRWLNTALGFAAPARVLASSAASSESFAAVHSGT
jgi:uncharacterized protein (TIGR02453 family)